jgi:hypothetical protein
MSKKPKKAAKRFLAGVVMSLLGKGIVSAYRRDSRARADIDSLGDNCAIKLMVQPAGPALLFGKKNGEVFSRKCAISEPADITLAFKGVEGAILMFTARLGLADGYAQHRFIVVGDLYKVMSIVRVMNIVEAYLFPRFIAKKLMNPVPKREVNMLRFYCGTLFGK